MLLGNSELFGEALAWVARPGWRVWTVVALALFMLDLAIRHVPGAFGLRRSARRPSRPATA